MVSAFLKVTASRIVCLEMLFKSGLSTERMQRPDSLSSATRFPHRWKRAVLLRSVRGPGSPKPTAVHAEVTESDPENPLIPFKNGSIRCNQGGAIQASLKYNLQDTSAVK